MLERREREEKFKSVHEQLIQLHNIIIVMSPYVDGRAIDSVSVSEIKKKLNFLCVTYAFVSAVCLEMGNHRVQ